MNKLFSPFSSLAYLDPRSLKHMSGQIIGLVENKLWAKILFGMTLGAGVGILFSATGPFSDFVAQNSNAVTNAMNWMGLPAQFFLRIIRMVIIPLILASIIRGLASTSDVDQIKKIGLRFGLFVFINTALAAALGVVIVSIVKPGLGINLVGAQLNSVTGSGETLKFSMNSLLDILPLNPLASIVGGEMLDVVVIALIGGVALISLEREQAKSVLNVLEIVQSICMTIISWAMKLAPYAVFGMMAQVASSSGLQALESMMFYVLVTFIGFTIFITFYVLLVVIFCKQSPFTFLKKISSAMLLAFSTSSSAATMPLAMKVAEEDLEVEPSVARFLIPLGTTINMSGSAIWQTSSVVFLSQAYNIDLSYGQILLVVATSVGSSIGSPGVPGVGMGILATVLAKVGIPLEGISLIMGVNRLVDMGCTVVNVSGDLTAAMLFGHNKKP